MQSCCLSLVISVIVRGAWRQPGSMRCPCSRGDNDRFVVDPTQRPFRYLKPLSIRKCTFTLPINADTAVLDEEPLRYPVRIVTRCLCCRILHQRKSLSQRLSLTLSIPQEEAPKSDLSALVTALDEEVDLPPRLSDAEVAKIKCAANDILNSTVYYYKSYDQTVTPRENATVVQHHSSGYSGQELGLVVSEDHQTTPNICSVTSCRLYT